MTPELKIRTAIIKLMRSRQWLVHIMHGNMYSKGLPDLWCAHKLHGQRWLEVKHAGHFHFTPAQREMFPEMTSHGVNVYVLALDANFTDSQLEFEYRKLFGPPNWTQYLGRSTKL